MPRFLKEAKGAPPQVASSVDVAAIVRQVIDDIRKNGDAAVRQYSEKFDKWSPSSFRLSSEQIEECLKHVPQQVITDIKEVQHNVRTFAQAQKDSLKDFEIEIQPGVHLGQKNNPLNTVGA